MILHGNDGTGIPRIIRHSASPGRLTQGCPSPRAAGAFLLEKPTDDMPTEIEHGMKGAADHNGGGSITHRWETDQIRGGGATQPHQDRVDHRQLEAKRLKRELQDAPTIK